MLAKVTIKRMTSKDVSTKKGIKKNLSLLVTTSKGVDMWVGGWPNDVTRGWREGDQVELDLEQRGKYWNFKPPVGDSFNGNGGDNGVSYEIFKDIQEIKSNVEKILKMVTSTGHVMGSVSEEPPVPRDEDAPVETDEIPF